MTKKEFTKKVLAMEHPVMEFGSDHSWENINCYCLVSDKDNWRNKVIVQWVRLSGPEYRRGDLESYNNRERKMKIKLEQWLYDICGNYCTIKPEK